MATTKITQQRGTVLTVSDKNVHVRMADRTIVVNRDSSLLLSVGDIVVMQGGIITGKRLPSVIGTVWEV